MPYPTPPTLNPFNASDVPNLMADGPYDAALTQIENYLAQLGQYLDAQIAAVRDEIPSSSDFATAEALEEVSRTASAASSAAASAQETATQASSAASTASGQAQEASATAATLTSNLSNLVGTLNNITVGSDKLIVGINADGTGTPTSPASESIMSEASSASTVAGEAMTDAEAANSFIGNLKIAKAQLPINISSSGDSVNKEEVPIFAGDGTISLFFDAIYNLFCNILLAAPNDDHSQLFGYLGDNTRNLASANARVSSSAALTAAYESGGSGEVPVGMIGVKATGEQTSPGVYKSYQFVLFGPRGTERTFNEGDVLYNVFDANHVVETGTTFTLNFEAGPITLSSDRSTLVYAGDLTVTPPPRAVPTVPISVNIDNYDREQKSVTMSTDGIFETTYAPGTIFIPTTGTRGDQGIVMLISTKSIVFEEGPDSITATDVRFDDPDNIEDNGQAKLLLIPSGLTKSTSDAALTSDDLASMKRTSDGYAYVG